MASSDDRWRERCAGIELLLLDVDGVLTDGEIIIDDHGTESKHFHVRDGGGLTLWRRAGKRAAILSGRYCRAVEHRGRELGIDPIAQGVEDKGAALAGILAESNLSADSVCYVGDDVFDLPVMRAVGMAAAPADAAPEAREAAHYVTQLPGGKGAVREVIEILLKAQGLWCGIIDQVAAPAC